jgi:hypothetical protein
MRKLIVLSILTGGLWAADFAPCPPRIEVPPQRLAKPVAGWTAGQAAEARHDLWFITMYNGEPKEMASLVPDVSERLKQGWTLAPQTGTFWLECHYTRTTVVLARPVPATAKSCEVTYVPSQTLDGHQVIKQITCK